MAGANIDEGLLGKQEAIINSMTPKERHKPEIIHASRKRRIAAGSGVTVQDVNRVLKMHKQMAGMMKKMSKGGMKGMMNMMGQAGVSPSDLAKMGGGAAMPGGVPNIPGLTGGKK